MGLQLTSAALEKPSMLLGPMLLPAVSTCTTAILPSCCLQAYYQIVPPCCFRLQDARVAAQARRAAGRPQTPLQAMLQRPLQASVVAVLIALHKVFALLCPAAVLIADSCTSKKFVTS